MTGMCERTNHLGQPIGGPLNDWKLSLRPGRDPLKGRYCTVEPLDPAKHADSLYAALSADRTGASWTYMRYGPFGDFDEFMRWMSAYCLTEDPFFLAFVEPRTARALGMATYCSIQPVHGTIEIGHVNFSPAMQRTAMATEAMFLMARNAIRTLKARRYEWRLDSLNAPSHAAARRFGFRYEGTFRNASHYKGRNRDTAWYSITDREWADLEPGYERWLDHLDPETGKQTRPLCEFLQPVT